MVNRGMERTWVPDESVEPGSNSGDSSSPDLFYHISAILRYRHIFYTLTFLTLGYIFYVIVKWVAFLLFLGELKIIGWFTKDCI